MNAPTAALSRRVLDAFYNGEDGRPGLDGEIADALPDIDVPAVPLGTDPETGKHFLQQTTHKCALICNYDRNVTEMKSHCPDVTSLLSIRHYPVADEA